MNASLLTDSKTLFHELSHSWWGGLVSSHGEGSKFLREAFASFSAAEALTRIKGKAMGDNAWRASKVRTFYNYYLAEQHPPPKVPLIIQEGFNPRMVTAFNYTKGALAIRAIKEKLGDELFFKCMRNFIHDHAEKNANIHDLIKSCNETTGEDLTPVFHKVLWETGYPCYKLTNWSCQAVPDGFSTTVNMYNAGSMALPCSLLLVGPQENEIRIFQVDPQKENILVFKTKEPVRKVIIDPDLTGYNYAPDQAIRFWKLFDNEFLGKTNWYWYNKSYAYYLTGDYAKALNILTEYLEQVRAEKGWSDLREGASQDWINGFYLFIRGYYQLAVQDTINAELDFKAGIPSICSILKRPEMANKMLACTGFFSSDNAVKELIQKLASMTGKAVDQSTLEEWRKWWHESGQILPLSHL